MYVILEIHLHTFFDAKPAPQANRRGRFSWGILLDRTGYLHKAKQYKKWQYSTAHSLECTRQETDGTSRFLSSGVKCGRETSLCLTQIARFGTLVKTIPWQTMETRAAMVLRLRGVHRYTERLRKWTLDGGACRKCIGTQLEQQEAK